jgi:hypothetical protein
MSRFRFARAAGLIVVLGLALPAAPGQDGGKKPPAKAESGPQVLREVYAVRGASAKELANALTLHFRAEPAFRAFPDAASNTLLLSGPRAVLEDATAVLRQIDRPARTVHVEVLCLELTGKAGGGARGNAEPPDLAGLSGDAREVRARVRDLQQKGLLASVKAVELTGLAGQSSRTQVSESRPYVTAVSFGGFAGRGGPGGAVGPTSRSVTYHNVGISVQVRPEVEADGQVTLELHVEDSRMRAAEGGAAAGADDKGTGVPAPEFVTSDLESRVKVRPGRFVLAQSTTAGSKAEQAQTVVLVSASTEEDGQKDGK